MDRGRRGLGLGDLLQWNRDCRIVGQIDFELRRSDGAVLDIEMLRPAEEIESQDAALGGFIYLEFNELEFSGMALVKDILPCPPIAEGDGCVVTARIVTRTAVELVEIEFDGGTRLTGTPNHPVWSHDRSDWIPLGDLKQSDQLLGADGIQIVIATKSVRSSSPKLATFLSIDNRW